MNSITLGPLLLFATVLYGTPGPATLSLAASGGAFGFRRSLPYLHGIVTGVFLNFLLVALGVAYLFQNFPVVYATFRYFSLVFILYLAYRIAGSGAVKARAESPLRYSQGVVLNLLNPKAYIAALVTLSQFAVPGYAYAQSVIVVITVVTLVALLVDIGWVYLGGMLAKLFATERQARILNVTLALVLVASAMYATLFVDGIHGHVT